MRIKRNVKVLFLCVAMLLTSIGNVAPISITAETVVTTSSLIFPGNFNKIWLDTDTGLDVYHNDGSRNKPYEIKNEADFAAFTYNTNVKGITFKDKYITITARQLDLAAHYWYPIGLNTPFYGNLEGNHCIIRNVFLGSSSNNWLGDSVGFFGYSFGNISNIALENVVCYSGTNNTGAFIGVWQDGRISNCSANGKISVNAENTVVGGFIGRHNTNNNSIQSCRAHVDINISVNNNTCGGFIGYINTPCTLISCNTTGYISTTTSDSLGGFCGFSDNPSVKFMNCYNISNIESQRAAALGGFIGRFYSGDISNSYSHSNLINGKTGYTGGFIGYSYNGSQKLITNVYCTGDIIGAINGKTGAFIGMRDENVSKYTNCYWNDSNKLLIGDKSGPKWNTYNGNLIWLEQSSTNYMKSKRFATDLNVLVQKNPSNLSTWEQNDRYNDGYPYLTVFKDSFIQGGEQDEQFSPDEIASQEQKMDVYGTVEFPEIETTSTPAPTGEPATERIDINLEWGALEYTYKSGEYDTDAKDFKDGVWVPAKEGVTDTITITNCSNIAVSTTYNFIPNTTTSANYADLTGTFTDCTSQTKITDSFNLVEQIGEAKSSANVQLGINGVPQEKINKAKAEVIGQVVVTISKYQTNVVEPEPSEEPEEAKESSQPTADTDVPATSQEPVEEKESSQPTAGVNVPVTTQEPVEVEESGQPTTDTDIPILSQEPEVVTESSQPTADTNIPVTTQTPGTTATPPIEEQESTI